MPTPAPKTESESITTGRMVAFPYLPSVSQERKGAWSVRGSLHKKRKGSCKADHAHCGRGYRRTSSSELDDSVDQDGDQNESSDGVHDPP